MTADLSIQRVPALIERRYSKLHHYRRDCGAIAVLTARLHAPKMSFGRTTDASRSLFHHIRTAAA